MVKLLFDNWLQVFSGALQAIPAEEVARAVDILDATRHRTRAIFMIGNGQSATTANAFALDLTKQTTTPPDTPRFRTISLACNVAALTAWGNDVSYEAVFTEQLKSLYRPDDTLIAISVSGNSPNVVNACQWVKSQGGTIIAFTGSDGGELAALADANIWVHSRDYGHVETAHIAVMHYLVDYFRAALSG